MARFVWGIILTAMGVMAILGNLDDKSNTDSSYGITFSFIMILIGVLLIVYGRRYINLRTTVLNEILRMLKESDGVNMGELVDSYNITEIQLRKFITHGQGKGILPKSDISFNDTKLSKAIKMEDIIKMIEKGLSENIIIERIRTCGVVNLTIDDMVEWKNKGISDTIIQESLKVSKK